MVRYLAQGCPTVHLVVVVALSMSSTSEHLGQVSDSIVVVLVVCRTNVRYYKPNRMKRADSFMPKTADTRSLAIVWLIVDENSSACACPHSIGTNSISTSIE